MDHDSLHIEVGGTEAPRLYDDLLAVEVELDEELTGMVRLTVALRLRADGSWSYLDDSRFRAWTSIAVAAGFERDRQELLRGYITHVRPHFGADLDRCVLEVWGMDTGVVMDRVDRLRDWPNKRDSDIAAEVFQSYGLTPRVTDTGIAHDEETSTVIQRETDLQLLRRLALRNGFECYVEGDVGHFGPPGLTRQVQPVLAVHFGDRTTVNHLRLQVDALSPTDVSMHQIDHVSGELLDTSADTAGEPLLGTAEPLASMPAGLPAPRAVVAQTVATGTAEMSVLCQGLRDRSAWFLTGEGEVAANAYGTVLVPRAPVTVKGVGETYSGVYYVTHVTHRFTREGYRQQFRVKRNAVGVTGTENFSGGSGALTGALAGAVAGGLGGAR